MAIKYIQIPEKKLTVAILENTRYSAVSKIANALGSTKSLCFNPDKYVMPNTFRAMAKCAEGDEWDAEVGRAVAKGKVMKKYYKSYDKKLLDFQEDLNNAMFETTKFF